MKDITSILCNYKKQGKKDFICKRKRSIEESSYNLEFIDNHPIILNLFDLRINDVINETLKECHELLAMS